MVDKDAFEEIKEKAWRNMRVTGMKGRIMRGRHLYSRLSPTVGDWRVVVVVDGWSWWVAVRKTTLVISLFRFKVCVA